VRAGADHRRRLGLDECLQHPLDGLADQVDVTAGAERVERFVPATNILGRRPPSGGPSTDLHQQVGRQPEHS
jgi:hypothetical protein